MAKYVQNEVEYFYDSNPTVEDLMGETSFHADLVHYLMEVLRWMFRGKLYAIYENLNFYQTLNPNEYPVAPDIAVIPGVERRPLRSWVIGKTGPAPLVVLEIASKDTWRVDVKEKPPKYARLGVQEYFLYDPETPQNMKHMGRRLIGWQFNTTAQRLTELVPDQQGRMWSPILESFLVPDGAYLRLYDRNYQLRLTGEEAREQREQMLEQKLRSLGINPDEI